jgi:formyl-CoA transferase
MEPGIRRHAPSRGEHTDEVLAEFGYSAAQIADLRARKVVV